ncbi:MAG: DUF2927 domain-containing protein, partial [Longimicrobiales bacterium]
MSGLKRNVGLSLLMTVFVGCEAEASTGPLEAPLLEEPGLAIWASTAAVPIERQLQFEARFVDPTGTPVPNAPVSWSSSDTVTAVVSDDGRVTGRFYGPVTVRAESGGYTAEAPFEVVPDAMYSGVDLEYFKEVALGAEYGSTSRIVRKWDGDIRIKVHGSPSGADMEALRTVVSDLSGVLGGRAIDLVSDNANLDIHFAPESEFHTIDPNYQSTNYGFFWVWWSAAHELTQSRVLISTTDISQEARSHLIREELTQSLGLMNDSWRYPESIYYQGWTRTNDYAPIDLVVIEMLYLD